jgi:hypothetical protein
LNLSGEGETVWPDGKRYIGHYLDDLKHGYGTFVWEDGNKYEGDWYLGKQHGKGVIVMLTGERKSGVWEDGRRIKWDDNNEQKCDGEWKDDLQNGYAIEEWPDGAKYEVFNLLEFEFIGSLQRGEEKRQRYSSLRRWFSIRGRFSR